MFGIDKSQLVQNLSLESSETYWKTAPRYRGTFKLQYKYFKAWSITYSEKEVFK